MENTNFPCILGMDFKHFCAKTNLPFNYIFQEFLEVTLSMVSA